MSLFKTNRLNDISFKSGKETVKIGSVATHSLLGGFWRKITYLGASKMQPSAQNPKQYVNIDSLCRQLINKRTESSGTKLDQKTINSLIKSAKQTYKNEFKQGITQKKIKSLYENIPVSFDGGIYRGPLNADGLPHGLGKIIYKDGSFYEGRFKAGQKTNGRLVKYTDLTTIGGKKSLLDVARNDKVIDETKKRHSYEKSIVLSTAEIRHSYEQSIALSTEGIVFKMSKKEAFEGDFENDVLIRGTYTRFHKHGDFKEIATIENGSPQDYNGQRTLKPKSSMGQKVNTFRNEAGHFVNSKLEGHGVREHPSIVYGTARFEGNFEEGKISGKGVYYHGKEFAGYINGQLKFKHFAVRLEGETFTENTKTHRPLLQGHGIETITKKDRRVNTNQITNKEPLTRYEGMFLNGLKHGKGKLVNENGDLFAGTWQEGYMNGEFKVYNKDNTLIFEGTYLNGVPHGRCKEYNPVTQKMETYHYQFNDGRKNLKELVTQSPLIIETYSNCGFIRLSTTNPAAKKIRDIPT